jgi:GTP-binding protein Era
MSKERAGFVSIIGMPNSGKSSLVNALSQGKISIISPKPQTTRQRIFSIVNDEGIQIVYSDTPGWILDARYPLHKLMNEKVQESLTDPDVLVLIFDGTKGLGEHEKISGLVSNLDIPVLHCINKTDLLKPDEINEMIQKLQTKDQSRKVFAISALRGSGVTELRKEIEDLIPEHPFYFPNDIISDKPVRFFVSEMIREQIFHLFEDEIPFSTFVEVISCKGVDEMAELARIEANIYVAKQSQVPILLGKGGSMIKELGIRARKEIEKFLGQKVYLGLSVKLKKEWRNDSEFIEKSGMLR